MNIPKQLQDEKFRFVLIKPKTKIPFEFNWQTKSNYIFNHKNIQKHNGNFGIVCGYGGLVVIDIDDAKLAEKFDKKYNTFSVKTGSGGRHYYFICDEKFQKSYYILGKGVGELRVSNSQVIIPSSTHPNGNKYEIFNDIDIPVVRKKFIKEILEDLLNKDKKIADISRSGQDWADVCEMIAGGYNFDECDKELMLIGSDRWRKENMGYKVGTYCNALKVSKKTR